VYADALGSEFGNITAVQFTLVDKPDPAIEGVFRYTMYSYWRRPAVALALALLPHLDEDPQTQSKADCLQSIGKCQYALATQTAGLCHVAVPQLLSLDKV